MTLAQSKAIPRAVDGSLGPESFGRLPLNDWPPTDPLADDWREAFLTAVDAAFHPLTVWTPSAWVQHGQTLAFLMSFFRPRRYVELGSHYGFSFCAACQATKICDLSTECIAIDHWHGDRHSGYYGENVYQDFLASWSKVAHPRSWHIRASFEEARTKFEEKSIDILLIDGFHTEQAVKNDFNAWISAVSESGIVILHDTCVYDHDFGVWRFWDEIKKIYPSLLIKHGYGLGILFCGSRSIDFSRSVLPMLEDKFVMNVFQGFVRGVGRMGALLAETRHNLDLEKSFRQNCEREKTELMAEVLQLRQSLMNLKSLQDCFDQQSKEFDITRGALAEANAKLAAISNSTSWRITAPLRWIVQAARRLRSRQ